MLLVIIYCSMFVCAYADEFGGTTFGEPEPETVITASGTVLDGNYRSRRIIDYADGYFIVEYIYDQPYRRLCGVIDMVRRVT